MFWHILHVWLVSLKKKKRLTPAQTIKMTTHSPSFPPDQRTLLDQVRTVAHPYLHNKKKKSSSLSCLVLTGTRRGRKWTETVAMEADLRGSRLRIVHLHLSAVMTDLTPPFPVQVSSSANSARHFRNYRPDDDTHLGTTGCGLNY